MLKYGISALALCWITLVPAHANELEAAALKLCENVKACAMAQMEGQDLTPEMREMMQPMLDNMCAQVQGSMGNVPTGHPLYQPAVACMESMNSLDCEMMQSAGETRTPECETFEKLARESGEME